MAEGLLEDSAFDQPATAPFQNMTVEEFRAQAGCEGYNDEQAPAVLNALIALADLIAENIQRNSQSIDVQCFVTLEQQKQAA